MSIVMICSCAGTRTSFNKKCHAENSDSLSVTYRYWIVDESYLLIEINKNNYSSKTILTYGIDPRFNNDSIKPNFYDEESYLTDSFFDWCSYFKRELISVHYQVPLQRLPSKSEFRYHVLLPICYFQNSDVLYYTERYIKLPTGDLNTAQTEVYGVFNEKTILIVMPFVRKGRV